MPTFLAFISLAVLLAGCGADRQSGSSEVSSLQAQELRAGANLTCGEVATGGKPRVTRVSNLQRAQVCQQAYRVWLNGNSTTVETLALTSQSEGEVYDASPQVAVLGSSSSVTLDSFREFCSATQDPDLKSSLGFSARQFAQLRSCTLDDITSIGRRGGARYTGSSAQ